LLPQRDMLPRSLVVHPHGTDNCRITRQEIEERMATVFRDRASLEAEVAMERESFAGVKK